MKMMFLDESGNHDLLRIDSGYPVFVLGGVIVDRSYMREIIDPAFRSFKVRHFGRDDIVLHTVEMHRGRGDYGLLADPARRSAFYSELNLLLANLDFLVVACVIKKQEWVERYGVSAADPYHVALKYLVERFCHELGSVVDGGSICAERRNPGLDRALLGVWEELRQFGTEHVSAPEIDAKIVALDLLDKRPERSALQLADLVITPIGRNVCGKQPRLSEVQWDVVERKLRTANDHYLDAGLIIRPK